MSRRVAREKALQSLFQMDVADVDKEQAMAYVLEETHKDFDQESKKEFQADIPYMKKLVQGTVLHMSFIDTIIRSFSIGWELERMATVDRNVLRIAVYELLYELDLPQNVVVNEAIELAKSFSTYESGKFVNGILGKMLLDLDNLRIQASNHDKSSEDM